MLFYTLIISNWRTLVVNKHYRSQCKYCQYPTITRVSNATHPQPTMLTTLLYIGSHDLHAHSVDLDSIYSTIELLKQVKEVYLVNLIMS